MKRVLLLLPTTGYRNNDFLAVAKKLSVAFCVRIEQVEHTGERTRAR
jgi:hypothetical protein